MKILYHHRIGSKDGQYVHIEELVTALRNQGHDVLVVGPGEFEDQPFGGESGFVAWLKRRIPGVAYELLEFLYNTIDFVRLYKALRRFQPDLVYERYNLYFLSGLMARRLLRVPLLLEVNAPLYQERSQFGGLRLRWLARWSEKKSWRGADHIFTVTHVLAEYLYESGVKKQRVSVTPNGINPQRFPETIDRGAAKHNLGLNDRLILGFVGFAREWHGLDTVIDLLSEYQGIVDLHFLLVGDGPARGLLEQQARDAGVSDQVTITGIVGRDQVAEYTSAFDIALQPDVVPYASPLKLFEYMACGSAIVAPATANLREILTNEHDALLFEADGADSFANAVHRLIKDTELRQRLGIAARQTLDDKQLTWAHNARRVTDIAIDIGCGKAANRQSDTVV